MTRGKPLSKDIIAKIRKGVLEDKSKYQIAKEPDLEKSTVYRWTRDLPSRYCGWPGIKE
jgi:transposase